MSQNISRNVHPDRWSGKSAAPTALVGTILLIGNGATFQAAQTLAATDHFRVDRASRHGERFFTTTAHFKDNRPTELTLEPLRAGSNLNWGDPLRIVNSAFFQTPYGASRPRTSTTVLEAYRRFHRLTRQPLFFQMGNRTPGNAAEMIAIMRGHFRQWQAIRPSKDEASSPGFEERQKRVYWRIQESTWEALRRTATNPSLVSALSNPYTPELFDRFVTQALPAYLAGHGVYCVPSLHAYSVPSGHIFLTASVVELHDLAAIESPDVGDELAQRIAQESMVVRQRLLIQPPLDAASVEEAASDRAYYGEIAQRNDAIEREVEGMVNGQSSLMAKLGIPDHSGPNFSDAISLDNLLDQLRQQVDPWELARSAVRTMFFGELHNLIELGRIRGETGKEVVQRLRKQIIDRHEAVHLLDEWDPKQTLYREFYARLGDSETLYMSALRFYLFHGEVNAIIGELRYGDPLMALDRLLAFTAPESAQLRARIANVDEHYRARLWVRQALLYFLDHGWGERFGMRFVPGINRADQIKVQLFRLSRPDCRPILNDLAEALQAKHDQAHLDPEAMLRQPTSRTWSWGCSMGLGAALVALAVWFIRRRSAHRQSGRPTM